MFTEFYKVREEAEFIENFSEGDRDKFKKLMEWIIRTLRLSIRERVNRNLFPKRGEIWSIEFGENIESEINKTRPGIILQLDINNRYSPLTIALPITNKPEGSIHDYHVELTDDMFEQSCGVTGVIIAEQIRAISKGRLCKKLGTLKYSEMKKVERAILYILGMEHLLGKNTIDNGRSKSTETMKPLISQTDVVEIETKSEEIDTELDEDEYEYEDEDDYMSFKKYNTSNTNSKKNNKKKKRNQRKRR